MVKFVERDGEDPDRLPHDCQNQLGRRPRVEASQALAQAIVVEECDIRMEQVQPFGRLSSGPLGHGIHRRAGDQHVAHQQQHDAIGGDLLPHVILGQQGVSGRLIEQEFFAVSGEAIDVS